MAMSTLQYIRQEKRSEILALAEKYGVKNVRIFGSVAREEDTSASDVDFLIDMSKDWSIHDWTGFWIDVEDLLDQRIDVCPVENLNPYLKPTILADARPL